VKGCEVAEAAAASQLVIWGADDVDVKREMPAIRTTCLCRLLQMKANNATRVTKTTRPTTRRTIELTVVVWVPVAWVLDNSVPVGELAAE
jgi:hypothetical protein